MMIQADQLWVCDRCGLQDVTHGPRQNRYHQCPATRMLWPLVPQGAKVRVSAVEREDYIGDEKAGRVMAIKTERQDGSNDLIVFAPTAQGEGRGLE